MSNDPILVFSSLKKMRELVKSTNNTSLINTIFLKIANVYTSTIDSIRYQIYEV